jgi:SAM-dependent methyltransferase
MRNEYLSFMCCPQCRSPLRMRPEREHAGKVESGTLECTGSACGKTYRIRNFVPRFVAHGKYAQSFGEQWKTFAGTQLDTDALQESEKRWGSEIGWKEKDLRGCSVIEFGSGAGRFVDIVSRRGARLVVGVDITDAVDAAQANLGWRDNVFFVQADLFQPPFVDGAFERGYSIGVLHHTPDPEAAFRTLVRLLNRNGKVGLSLYEICLFKRPSRNSLRQSTIEVLWALNMWRVELFRVFTTRMPDPVMIAYCKYFVPGLHYLNKIPVLRYLRYLFPSTCYRNLPVEWSMVDTNDTYATKIVHMYRHKDVFQWFMRANVQNIIVHNSIAGWVSLTGAMHSPAPVDYAEYLHEQPIVQ